MTRSRSMPASAAAPSAFRTDLAFAQQLDRDDPLKHYRERFHIPTRADGSPVRYFCGNSLGLQPKAARALVEQELDDWAKLAVDAHFHGNTPWFSYHEVFRDTGARLVGARPGEVVMMNSLTVNLHLMMVSFFQPSSERNCILIEHPAFPSDLYAVSTHLQSRGLDPETHLLIVRPPAERDTLDITDFENMFAQHGQRIALALLGGVNFYTGQVLPMPQLTELAHRHGCAIGFDLAHAAGNIDVQLHDWNVDFACWCSYKYLNAGPGAVAGCFIHNRHATQRDRVRLGGWWGNDPATRFRMHLEERFIPRSDADGWQLSNPPILALAPLRASLEIFDEATMPALRQKSIQLTGLLRFLIEQQQQQQQRDENATLRIITPRDPAAQGCQLSIQFATHCAQRFERMRAAGFVCDFRPPDVIRMAPTPLYNTYEDVWHLAHAIAAQDAMAAS